MCSTSGVNQATRDFTVSGAPVETERPLVVLVDGRVRARPRSWPARSSDHGRAVIIGRRTYGKATVQSLIALSNGGALKLTTATYLTPNGASIGGAGSVRRSRLPTIPATRPDEAVAAAAALLAEKL